MVHCKLSPYDIYIGRPSIWGNPYSHKPNTRAQYHVPTVEEAVEMYRHHLSQHPELIERAHRELKGKVLGCWCKTPNNPHAPCHGDVPVEVISC